MTKTTNSLIILFILCIVVISGCSSKQQNFRDRQGRMSDLTEEERQRMFQERGIMQNMTEEGRQQMFEERQQKAIESCQGKNEGDSCVFESPRGEMEGVCTFEDKNLLCRGDVTMRLFKE